jgi:hypothetical protein
MTRNLSPCWPRCALLPVLAGLAAVAAAAPPGWDLPHAYRVPVSVGAAGHARRDLPVEVGLDFAALLKAANAAGIVRTDSLRVVEVDDQGAPLAAAVPHQFDAAAPGQKGTLVLLLTGETRAGATRRFHVYFDTAAAHESPATPAQVKLTDAVPHQGQDSYQIETPAGTWLYHKQGAGFASLFDADGNDWLSYRPTGGSAGNYRGIPNLVHPEGYFHPGGTKCTSRVAGRGPLCVRIESEAEGGTWACTWDVYPHFARLTVLKAPKPYWFLYEGTPGGQLDHDDDYAVRSDGRRSKAGETWDDDLPAPEWLYFGDRKVRRALFLVHHADDAHPDAYWPMQGNMTVFGFGRLKTNKFLDRTPTQFTVGLCEEAEFDRVKEVVESVSRPPEVDVGRAEAKEGRTP